MTMAIHKCVVLLCIGVIATVNAAYADDTAANPSSSFFQRKLQQIVTPFSIAKGIFRYYIAPKPIVKMWDRSFGAEQRAYSISLGTTGVSDLDPFLKSIDVWTNVITSDLEEVCTNGIDSDECGCLPCPIDDLHICGQYIVIDGVGGILGAAGPTRLRTSNSLPVTGIMIFDSDDINAGSSNITETILHEMAHVIGIGTLWSTLGLAGASTTCSYSSSSQATLEYQKLSGCTTAVPIENDGGSGTACGHWDEVCFDTELMTGYSDTTNPLSAITIGGMQDLGYGVDFSQKDSGYTSANMASSCVCSRRGLRGTEESYLSAKVEPLGGHRRRLSDAGKEAAKNYADQYMKSKVGEAEVKQFGLESSDDTYYVGDRVISVLYVEDGHFYSILVDNLGPRPQS